MRDNDIKQYYKDFTEVYDNGTELDLLNQVGKTQLGKVITALQLKTITDSIVGTLEVTSKDTVVDYGCANGLVTSKVAPFAHRIYGYDLCEDLIKVAKQYSRCENVSYEQLNVLNSDLSEIKADKFYMYEVLQHFNGKMLRQLLKSMTNTKRSFSFFIGSVPDAEKKWSFYFNEERRRYYFTEVVENGQFHLGNWWYKEHILMICDELGLDAKIIDQAEELHTSHYRFDVLITKEC